MEMLAWSFGKVTLGIELPYSEGGGNDGLVFHGKLILGRA